MERVAVDICGPLKLTRSGNKYICVVMDYFSKWPEAYAIPDQEATTVATAVSDFFFRFGVPQELHSDQGSNFESAVFTECCQLLGIRKTRTTPLRPQSDGMVERFNRTLAQELAAYCHEEQDHWDELLPHLMMAYRSAEHSATGYTPARLMLGRELRLPVDLLTGRPPHDELPESTPAYVKALQERLADVHHKVRANLQTTGQSMKLRFDCAATDPTFKVGDRVWLHNPRRKKGLSTKLLSPWEGPFVVEERLSAVTFRIRAGQRAKSKVVHANRLWLYHGPGQFSWTDPVDAATSEEAGGGTVDDIHTGGAPPYSAEGAGAEEDDGGAPPHSAEGVGAEEDDDEAGATSSPGVHVEEPAGTHSQGQPRPRRNTRWPTRLQDFVGA